jgi:nitrite reductase (NAD(P)H)
MKLDAERRQYHIVVIGEEPYPAYNRVSLSSFFEHRKAENLYLNPKEWVRTLLHRIRDTANHLKYTSFEPGSLSYHLNTKVTEIIPERKLVVTSSGTSISYDTLVLATGSDAILPTRIPGADANGVFVYRTISDLVRLIEFGSKHQGDVGITVGGGLLGLEAAKGMWDMKVFRSVKVVEMCPWLLARQLDADAGNLVTEKVRLLGLDVLLHKQVSQINADSNNNVAGITFADGERIDCSCICFAVHIFFSFSAAESILTVTGWC